MALGFFLRGLNQGAWVYREVILHLDIPDPYFWDIILFFHVIPIMAAVGWRPDLTRNESRFQLSALNFLMLLVWWIFLYAFIVFPHQYVVLNVPAYEYHYEGLYQVENLLVLAVLGFAAVDEFGTLEATCTQVFSALLFCTPSGPIYWIMRLPQGPITRAVCWTFPW